VRGWDGDFFRIAAVELLPDHVAVRQQVVNADALAGRDIDSGDLVTERTRHRRALWIDAIVRIAVAHARSANVDDHFARARQRISDILRDERRAVALQTDRSQRRAF